MSNLIWIPSADHFETRLANLWNWTVGTVYVDEVPSGSITAWEYSYIVVNPWESNMQVAKVDWWDIGNKTFNVVDLDIPSGVGTSYTAKNHPLWSKVTFSNNYAFWKDIQDAVNSKADDSSISAVWKSNNYTDLDNTPVLSLVALSNDYNDLDNLPTPISIDAGDNILWLSLSNELSATVSASYDSWTQKITLYGANSAVLSEIDCTEFIKDGMIQDVEIVTDPVWYAPWKYLKFDFNTDSWVTDIYIALSDLAVYTAWTWIDITSNAISLKKATTNSLWWVIVWSGLSVNDGTISADSQTDENYTTAEKTKLWWIESWAEVNDIEKVQVNWTDLPITAKAVNVQIKTINGNSLTWSGDLDLMARTYSAGTWIDITCDTISINCTYQTTIANKANSADLSTVATTWKYCDLSWTPEACDYDIKDLADTTWLRLQKSSSAPWTAQQWDMWYDTTNEQLKTYNWTCSCWEATWGGGWWSWDMLACVYDPNSVEKDAFDMNNMENRYNYAEPTTAAACTTKCVCIPAIKELCVWQTIIIKPTTTATNCATDLKLNDFCAYPVRYNNAALTSTTDWYVRWADCLSTFLFDWSYWQTVSKSYDVNTTYTLNTLLDAWKYTAWTGTYALSRYSLVMEKDDWTWEKITNTSEAYSTATTKTVNTNWFKLNHIRYYSTTTNVATGVLIATNVLANQHSSVDLRYSTNCWWTTTWAEWDYIYLVGTMWVDWLFYLDTTTWWTNQLPVSNDWKLYIRIWLCLAANWYTASLLADRPIYYYDNGIKLYEQVDNKQDVLVDWTNIKTVNWQNIMWSGNLTVWTVMTETDYGQITPVNWVMYFTTA